MNFAHNRFSNAMIYRRRRSQTQNNDTILPRPPVHPCGRYRTVHPVAAYRPNRSFFFQSIIIEKKPFDVRFVKTE